MSRPYGRPGPLAVAKFKRLQVCASMSCNEPEAPCEHLRTIAKSCENIAARNLHATVINILNLLNYPSSPSWGPQKGDCQYIDFSQEFLRESCRCGTGRIHSYFHALGKFPVQSRLPKRRNEMRTGARPVKATCGDDSDLAGEVAALDHLGGGGIGAEGPSPRTLGCDYCRCRKDRG